jgi:hypothetical protein
MTAKEKALELKDKFQKQIFFHVTNERLDINEAKGLALIAVEEILCKPTPKQRIFWQQVKDEILNL